MVSVEDVEGLLSLFQNQKLYVFHNRNSNLDASRRRTTSSLLPTVEHADSSLLPTVGHADVSILHTLLLPAVGLLAPHFGYTQQLSHSCRHASAASNAGSRPCFLSHRRCPTAPFLSSRQVNTLFLPPRLRRFYTADLLATSDEGARGGSLPPTGDREVPRCE